MDTGTFRRMMVKLDENLPAEAAELLVQAGHDAKSVRDQNMGGWKDTPLWEAIQAENRFLVTADKGFADIRLHPPGTHAGVLVLRPDNDGIEPLVSLLLAVLRSTPLEA
jgi:predicted nuclease of predicted toxin-antitoxin system